MSGSEGTDLKAMEKRRASPQRTSTALAFLNADGGRGARDGGEPNTQRAPQPDGREYTSRQPSRRAQMEAGPRTF